MKPMTVGVRDAKANLSRLLKLVQKGREIILTDRGRPVGKLIPVDTQALPLHERIRALEEEGILDRPSGQGVKKFPSPIPIPRDLAQKYLQEDRENG